MVVALLDASKLFDTVANQMEIIENKSNEASVQCETSSINSMNNTLFNNCKSLLTQQSTLYYNLCSTAEITSNPTRAKNNGNCAYVNPKNHTKRRLSCYNLQFPIVESTTENSYSPNDSEFFDALQTPFQSDNDQDKSPIQTTIVTEMLEIPCIWTKVMTEPRQKSTTFQHRRENVVKIRLISNSTEDSVLEILREVVRKCTANDPYRRPKAKDIVNILTTVSNQTPVNL